MLTIFRDIFSPPRHMILLVVASWIGLTLAEKQTERRGIGKDSLNNLIFAGLLGFVFGGRVSFVLQNIPAFIKSPLGVLSINPDLFDLPGALAAAFIAALIYGQRQNLSLWPSLDALTPFFAILAVGVGLSRLAAGTAFGLPTKLPWAIDLWSAERHPTQIYETLASLLTFGLLWFKKPHPRPGMDFLIFAALTAAFQLFLAGFRADSVLILNGLRREQIVAWVVLVVCFILFETRLKKTKNG